VGNLPSLAVVVIDLVVFVSVYLTCAPLVWGIDGDDIVRLSIAGEALGPARRIVSLTLRYEKRVLVLLKRV